MSGVVLAEALVGAALGVTVLAGLTAALGTGGRALALTGARAEAIDTVAAAVEALTFDVRAAGWDPAAGGAEPMPSARTDGLVLQTDLDGDGSIDATSEERVAWACLGAPPRLERVVGAQALPVAASVTGCGFRYLDATGATIAIPAAGLDAVQRATVRAVVLDVGIAPGGLRAAQTRTGVVAVRSAS